MTGCVGCNPDFTPDSVERVQQHMRGRDLGPESTDAEIDAAIEQELGLGNPNAGWARNAKTYGPRGEFIPPPDDVDPNPMAGRRGGFPTNNGVAMPSFVPREETFGHGMGLDGMGVFDGGMGEIPVDVDPAIWPFPRAATLVHCDMPGCSTTVRLADARGWILSGGDPNRSDFCPRHVNPAARTPLMPSIPSLRRKVLSFWDRMKLDGADHLIDQGFKTIATLHKAIGVFRELKAQILGVPAFLVPDPDPCAPLPVHTYDRPFFDDIDPVDEVHREVARYGLDRHPDFWPFSSPDWASAGSERDLIHYPPGGFGMREFRESTFEPLYLGIFR